jgi:2-methylcitrate dehydratase PrpD
MLVREGVDIKKYPCCYYTHPGIAATQDLVATHDIAPAEVERIIVMASQGAADALHYQHPTTGLEGKFSMEYVIAAAVARDRVDLAAFTDAAVADPTVEAVRERVDFEVDPDFSYDPFQTVVEVRTADGNTHRIEREEPPGTAANPLSGDELAEKFRRSVASAPAGVDAERALDLLEGLRSVDDVDRLVGVLQPT